MEVLSTTDATGTPFKATPFHGSRLNNRQNARSSLSRVIRDFDGDPNADPDRFKVLIYALATLLSFDKAADADALAERLQAIEARLDAAGK